MRSSAFERKRKKSSKEQKTPQQVLLLRNKIMASEFRSHTLDAFMDMMTQFIQACRCLANAGLQAMELVQHDDGAHREKRRIHSRLLQ